MAAFVLSTMRGALIISVTGLMSLHALTTSILNESPAKAHTYNKQPRQIVTNAHFRQLSEKGVVVIDNCLSMEELDACRQEIITEHLKGDKDSIFGPNDNEDDSVRHDRTALVYESGHSNWHFPKIGTAVARVIHVLRSVPYELLNMSLNSIISDPYDEKTFGVPLSNQLAVYDGNNAHYIPHRDALTKNDLNHPLRWFLQPGLQDRKITIIIYLNELQWTAMKGDDENDGNLKLYLNTKLDDETGATADEVLYIKPHGGRMVIFDSRILHEVLPTSQQRLALTCWVGGKHSKLEMLRRLFIPLDVQKKNIVSTTKERTKSEDKNVLK
jgi:hypothetical protein